MKRIILTDFDGQPYEFYVGEHSAVEVMNVPRSSYNIHSKIRVNGGKWVEVYETQKQIASQLGQT